MKVNIKCDMTGEEWNLDAFLDFHSPAQLILASIEAQGLCIEKLRSIVRDSVYGAFRVITIMDSDYTHLSMWKRT